MKPEEQLRQKYGTDSGMRVPEGYFPDLEQRILASLPPYVKVSPKLEVSSWQRVKPYVYLAAMFCGIWLMMKVFHTATRPLSLSLDNPPEALVDMIDGGLDYDVHYLPFMMEDFDEEDQELIMSYDSIEDFEKDFGYTLKPEYSTMPAEPATGKNG